VEIVKDDSKTPVDIRRILKLEKDRVEIIFTNLRKTCQTDTLQYIYLYGS
jgi:hypothetical protein